MRTEDEEDITKGVILLYIREITVIVPSVPGIFIGGKEGAGHVL